MHKLACKRVGKQQVNELQRIPAFPSAIKLTGPVLPVEYCLNDDTLRVSKMLMPLSIVGLRQA